MGQRHRKTETYCDTKLVVAVSIITPDLLDMLKDERKKIIQKIVTREIKNVVNQ